VKNRVLFQSEFGDLYPSFQTGVSLHGHTRHSVESLAFLDKFLNNCPLLRSWVNVQRERGRRNTGISLDLQRAHWTPPLCERQAYDLESLQIEGLGLRPLISLSDHDSIKACTLLRELPQTRDTPVSAEWTISFRSTTFHIGIHNLPPGLASSIMFTLLHPKDLRGDAAVLGMIAEISEIPGVLLVLNHPLWNLNGIPGTLFAAELADFLRGANRYLHAFELNGMRSYSENREVMKLAANWDQPLISGGDRHGCEANAVLNLTDAIDFSEFVDEVRCGKQSTILLMQQYEQRLNWRMYKSFTHVIGHYPGHIEGRRFWDERIYHPDLNGQIVPVVDLWHLGPPGFLKKIFALGILGASLPVPARLNCWSGQFRKEWGRSATDALEQTGTGRTCPTAYLCETPLDFPGAHMAEGSRAIARNVLD
jgi:hypothetical protein